MCDWVNRRRRPERCPMEDAPVLTGEQIAALLCYLATAELAAFALQGAWLSEANLVESTRIWFARNHLTTGWLDR